MASGSMTPRQRLFTTLRRGVPDRMPRMEVWIDACLDELGQADPWEAYANLGQDAILLPMCTPPGSNAWKDGVDEWGRIWRGGMYAGGAVETRADLRRYSPPLEYARELFDEEAIARVRRRFPDHAILFGTHIGPLTAAYMAMGFERFFFNLVDQPGLVHELLELRTEWCLAVYRRAVELGAELLVLGDDAAHKDGPLISPRMARRFVLPYHQCITAAFNQPMLWHSDGDVRPLLPLAVEAGFIGMHGLEPAAGIDLAHILQEWGRDLVLAGNVDVRLLCGADLAAVRRDVRRCQEVGAAGGCLLSTCNSIFSGMNPAAVKEYFYFDE